MRFEGILKSWNDDRGFGFIEPTRGGQQIFVHVKAFPPQGGRPQVNQLVSFEVESGPQGKKRAKHVELIRRAAVRKRGRRQSPTHWGAATLFAIPGFAVLFLTVAVLWKPPLVLAEVYGAISLVTFLAYARDKSAARRGGWRTPEQTLHLLAIVGGWPGALLAQQFLRHKSTKAEFRAVFWGTVILNVTGFVLLCSPVGRSLWAVP